MQKVKMANETSKTDNSTCFIGVSDKRMVSRLIATYILTINLITFLLYGIDKWRAKRRAYRISEATLHAMALVGGSIGALIGQRVFRHKTKKVKFRVVYWLIVVLQGAMLLWAARTTKR